MKLPELPLSASENVDKRHKINYIVAYELYRNTTAFTKEPTLEQWRQLFETDTVELDQRYESARAVIDALDPVDRATVLARAATFGQD